MKIKSKFHTSEALKSLLSNKDLIPPKNTRVDRIIKFKNMNRKEIVVPKGIRYIGEWSEYGLENFNSPHILNKTLTGCGFTEYCIRCGLNVVVCSPRRFLLENKEDQHQGEVFYARNDIESVVGYDKDISTMTKGAKIVDPPVPSIERVLEFKDRARDYVRKCRFNRKAAKILVTYDSFRHIKEVLVELGVLEDFYIVVDEFQSIFIDSRFKSHTELELLYQLLGIQKVCFVSATPMLDEYLDMLDEFKNLPYYELNWSKEDPDRVISPKIEVRYTKRGLNEEINKIIQPYLSGEYERRRYIGEDGRPYEVVSKEAVIYVNSVKAIVRAIINNRLTPDQCNVLCAKTLENNKLIKQAFNKALSELGRPSMKRAKAGTIDAIGSIPKQGEPHKMFTFCTRTVYLGADFYSTNARTFIFCDSNIDCLSVDISMDLEQIMGRQRLDINPWKNSAYLVVKTTEEEQTKEVFDKRLEEKKQASYDLLDIYRDADPTKRHSLAKKYESEIKLSHYLNDYVAVNHHAGSDLLPVFNNLMLVSEMRAFDIQQVDYKDRFSVYNALGEAGFLAQDSRISDLLVEFNGLTTFPDKIKFIHNIEVSLDPENMGKFLDRLPGKFKDYYLAFGTERMKALKYLEADIEREWNRISQNSEKQEELEDLVYSTFEVGSRYSYVYIKSTLKDIYEKLGYKSVAKAKNLENYFNLKVVKVITDSGVKDGFEIISRK